MLDSFYSITEKREELLCKIVEHHTSPEFVQRVKCCDPSALKRLCLRTYVNDPDKEYVVLDDEVIGMVTKPILKKGSLILKYNIAKRKDNDSDT